MNKIATILLFLALWDGPGRATVAWESTGRSCLYKQGVEGNVFLGCWDGPARVTFGGSSNTDGRYRPTAGDVYILQSGGVVSRAPLRSVTYLAVWR